MVNKLRAIVKLGDSHDSSGVKDQGPPNRSLLWEEDAPAETTTRRVRPVASQGNERSSGATRGGSERVLPGMPLEFDDVDEHEAPTGRRSRSTRFDEPKDPWWRPASKTGRVIVALGALVVLGGLTAAGLTLKKYLERDSRFRIAGSDNIAAIGLAEVRRADLLPVFGEDIGRNIFFVPLTERRKQLEQIAWVKQATVMRLLPDQIRVSIVERQPVAFTRNGNRVGLVDADGVLLSMPAAAMAKHHYSFPVLTGIDRGDSAEARRTRVAVYLRMMSGLDAGGQHNSEQISEIDLTDPEDARVTMPEPGADILAHFGEDNFLERYQRYQAHIAEWRQQYPNLVAVDLRYEQQIVLQMTSGKETSQGAQGVETSNATKAKPVAGASSAAKATAKAKSTDTKKTTSKSVGKTASSTAAKKRQQEMKKSAAAKKVAPQKSNAKQPAQAAGRNLHPATTVAQGG
jgi:cell division protein FtsQ